MSRNRTKNPMSKRKPGGEPEDETFPQVTYYNSPFEGLSQQEADDLLRISGEDAQSQFNQTFAKLKELLFQTDPLCLLSWLSFYGLARFGNEAVEKEPEKRIWQHEVELIQALVLQHDRTSFGAWNFRITENIHDHVRTSQQNFELQRLSNQHSNLSAGERAKLLAIELMRANTQMVRNWGYPEQIARICSELLNPIDDEIESIWGVRTDHLINMCISTVAVAQDRSRAHLERLAVVLGADSITSLARNYCTMFNDLNDEPEDLTRLFTKHQTTLDEAKIMITHHADLRLPELFTFTLDDLLSAYPGVVSKENLKQVIRTWSIGFGDLSTNNSEYFFLNNPVWRQPFITLGNDIYFCPIVGMLYTFMLDLMESIIETDQTILANYERRRGEFLEESVEQMFKAAFPTAKVFRGSMWIDPQISRQYENDLLILLDSHLIVVEAKAGKVSDAARRGALLSLEDTIEKLQIDASIQANRFARFLQETKDVHQFNTRSGAINEVDNRSAHRIVRLNCILETLDTLSLPWSELRDAGFISDDVDLVPTISLSDLEVVFHLLDSPLEKLHYLVRRTDFEKHVRYLGDEMDLLAFYIDSGFNIGEAEFTGSGFMLHGIDEMLRPYFLSLMSGQEYAKPKRRYTDLWHKVLSAIITRKQPGWTHLGMTLLNANHQEQELFEEELQTKKKQLLGEKASQMDESFYLQIGPPQRGEALVGLVCRQTPRDLRNQLMKDISSRVLTTDTVNHGLVFALDVENDEFPYSVMVYFQSNNVEH